MPVNFAVDTQSPELSVGKEVASLIHAPVRIFPVKRQLRVLVKMFHQHGHQLQDSRHEWIHGQHRRVGLGVDVVVAKIFTGNEPGQPSQQSIGKSGGVGLRVKFPQELRDVREILMTETEHGALLPARILTAGH